ncbi:PREDICTED: mannan endo-1,4-beta-mannosidase 6 isoform X1 [Camelina sativa]|uniref:mannan endo-1,4-beta-mannosidase n=4 Tax=Camelina sativa TaxID=90675 RepID=A0ABM0TC60_CAMSA|nr:PREDICTED: mannan endo-1,4-beta-mannosidase 6 isoform X1 [Camelina sativa]
MHPNEDESVLIHKPAKMKDRLGFRIVLCSAVFIILTQNRALADFDSESHEFNSEESVGEEEWEMVERKGMQFTQNGQPFYVNGFNTYWMMVLAADNSTRGKVTEVFQQASAVGMTVGRTWAFNDGQWRALQKSPSVYDEEVFKALDFVVSEARKYKIRLILSLVNNWDAYGGKAQYVKWGNASGLNLTSDDDFFTNPTLRNFYQSHVRTVLNRVNTYTNITYKNDPTIFAWELMNEPRCPSDPSGDKLQSWIQEMAAFVKSIDAKHLVEIGLEGFYGPSAPARTRYNPNSYAAQVGTDFIRNNQALGVDFATVHVYPDTWISPCRISPAVSNSFLEFTSSWMQSHVEDAEMYLGMPVLFTEFGVSAHDPGFNTSFRDMMLNTVYKMTLNSTRKGGAGAGSLVWQVFPQGAEFMDDGYAVYLTRAHTASKIISLQSKRLAIFNSLCSWRCKWGCKKKNHTALDALLSHDEL